MKIKTPEYDKESELFVISFGYEEISEKARWGRGQRNAYFLHYVTSGDGYFNGKKLSAGKGFLISPKMMHEYHSSKSKPWQYFWVSFNGVQAEKICKKHIEADKDGIFEFKLSQHFSELVDEILNEQKEIDATAALGYFLLFLSVSKNEKVYIPKNKYVEQAKRHIEANLHRTILIRELAEGLNIDDRYLYNLFIKYEGVSPKKYINSLREKRASSLLKNTAYTVSEIAELCGFSDVLAFSKFFSKENGASPSNYRKKNSV